MISLYDSDSLSLNSLLNCLHKLNFINYRKLESLAATIKTWNEHIADIYILQAVCGEQ